MHRQRPIAAVLLVLAALAGTHDAASLSPSSDIQPYISGGTLSNNGRLKYVVEIIKAMKVGDLLKEHLGEGALLTTDWVLTTAAAAPDLSWAESLLKHVLVVVGRADGSDGVDVGIDDKKSVVEPNNKILKLLKLKEPVVLGALIKPANLPSFATDSTGLGAILAGWGKDRKALNAVDVKVFSKEQCTADGVTVADDEICTSAEGNACKGDDGAPLAIDRNTGAFRLVGLATGADKQSDKCDQRSVYVNVAKYTKWLLTEMYP